MKKIAITGGLSSGKSSVCQILQSLGAYIISSDEVVLQLFSIPENIFRISEICGAHVLVNGKVDRQKVASLVFNEPEKLRDLEKLLHPQALDAIIKKYKEISVETKARAFVVEVPLLFEAGWQSFFDLTILIASSLDQAKSRYLKQGHSENDFNQRTARLWTDELRRKHADIVIENEGTLEDLERKISENVSVIF
ncbi:MAG: dephospho-CoA kinase [Simkaniaceae bacterium]|nr:dephospho-CoA kinase [Simkaniaceae bacterium]